MDRMLIAAALRADLAVVTEHVAFAAYGVPTIW
jgi:PIN domain nuclease of toxin-antitoxin system